MVRQKIVALCLDFFFAAFPDFFFHTIDNRLRLADLGGVEPLRSVVQRKLEAADALV